MDKRQFSVIVICLLLIAGVWLYSIHSENERAEAARNAQRMREIMRDIGG